MVDVSDHELVPEHNILDEEDLDDVLAEYDIDRTDLPKIKRTDSALPDGAEVGDVIEIVRNSRTTDRAVVYRLVVE
ncbi:DNA-directed RNA polymerase subunit H [Halorientalis marina]|jgi:DNA-directed RNA polymerase subunit H|uniref:DNA-directed RNA polymerase subunit H n=1 Tax=Halorientalis marina TaxID=2931976 RepID=UPI001FF0EEF2|nr:DNA-directed RNA polymerase subunit H [Halorientalis marina]